MGYAALVLMVGGLVPGNNVPAADVTPPTTARMVLTLRGGWKGTWRHRGEAPGEVAFIDGMLPTPCGAYYFSLVPHPCEEGRGKAWVTWKSARWPGIYELRNGRLWICLELEGDEPPRTFTATKTTSLLILERIPKP